MAQMALSDARNSMPDAIGVATPRIGRGPDLTAAQSVKAFGELGGQAYEGAVTGSMNKELSTVGNEIATLNNAVVEDTVTPQGAPAGPAVNIGRADPTGTVDQTSERFKLLAQSRLQGKITQQRAMLEADVVLRHAITRAPGFSAELRTAAAAHLGFNPSGAALEQLYLSGPDTTKTTRQTQQEKDLEQAQSYVYAGVYPDQGTAFRHIQEARNAQDASNIMHMDITAGSVAYPKIVNAAVVDFNRAAGGLLLGIMTQATGEGVQDPQKWTALLAEQADKQKQIYRTSMMTSDIPYQQEAYDALNKAVDAQVKTYTDIANNSDLTKLLKDRKDAVIAVGTIAGIRAAPDMFAVYQVGGQSGVDAYLKLMQLVHGDPKAAKELAHNNPQYGYLLGVMDDMQAASGAISAAIQGNLPEAIRLGSVSRDNAEKLTRGLGDTAIDSGDPAQAAAAAKNAFSMDMKNVALGTLAHTPGSFLKVDDATKLNTQRATLANYEMTKNNLATRLAGSQYELTYNTDKSKYEVVPRANATLSTTSGALDMSGSAELGGFPLQALPGTPQAPRGPDVESALQVLNDQIQPLMDQPEWATFITNQNEYNPDAFRNQTVNTVNSAAAQQEIFGNDQTGLPEATNKIDMQTQAAISKGMATAIQTGDRTALDEALAKAGIPASRTSNVQGTGSPVERIDAGVYRDKTTGAMFEVTPDGKHRIVGNDPNSGTIQRGPNFGDAGAGVFQLPDNMAPNAAKNAAILQDAAHRNGVDPAVMVALGFQESSLNETAQNPDSSAGGLTGLIDATAKELGVSDKTDPFQAADGGARYLKKALEKTDGNYREALARYHGGVNKDKPDVEDYAYADQILNRLSDQASTNVVDLKDQFM
jgi:hypothetical protein